MRTSASLCALFDCSTSELASQMKRRHVMYPVAYMRWLPLEALYMRLAHYSSTKKLAAELGVSESTLKKEIRGRGAECPMFPNPTRVPELKMELARLGSVTLVSTCWSMTERQVREQAKEDGIEVAAAQKLEKRGKLAVGKGRRGELAYASRRGRKITRDLNVEEGSQALYDFDDLTFGRVNVKASKKQKSGGEFCWRFSLSGAETCDTFALMMFDSRWGKDIHCVILRCSVTTSLGMGSIIVRERIFKGVPPKDKRFVYKKTDSSMYIGVDGLLVAYND